MQQIFQIVWLTLFLFELVYSEIILKVEFPKGSKSYTEKHLIDYLNESEAQMTQLKPNASAIMILGLSGTGKTTLINYLNDIPLYCKKLNGKWIIDLEFNNQSLPGGFNIGHESQSETLTPNVFASKSEEYSYIDNPGFKDTRGIAIEISNVYLRERITSNVKYLKFLLILTQAGIDDARSDQVRDSIRALSNFLGIFKENDTKSLNKSIGIIVTRVNDDGETMSNMRENFKKSILTLLSDDNMFENDKYKNEKSVLKEVLEANQIEIFCNPKKEMVLDKDQSIEIKKLISRLQYVEKDDMKINRTIDNSYISELIKYSEDRYKFFIKNFEEILNQNVLNYIKNNNNKFHSLKYSAGIYQDLKEFINFSDQLNEFDYYVSKIDSDIFSKSELQLLLFNKSLISFLASLLPIEHSINFSFKKKWINDILRDKLKDRNNELIKYIEKEILKFENDVEIKLIKFSSIYFIKSIDKVRSFDEIKVVENFLKNLIINIKESSCFNVFVNNFSDEIIELIEDELIKNEKIRLIEKKKFFDLFIDKMTEEKNRMFNFKIRCAGGNLKLKINFLMNEIQQYYKQQDEIEFDHKQASFIYKGYFGNMSSILPKINNDRNVSNLKSVKIYTTHSFLFDSDYKIVKERYNNTHSPDLIIISPVVKIEKIITVDLSCENLPGLPDNVEKADPGTDGKPGLPGCNAGILTLLADQILEKSNMKFISVGGKGGTGQDGIRFYFKSNFSVESFYIWGGDGINGIKGRDAIVSEVKCDYTKIAFNDYTCKPKDGTILIKEKKDYNNRLDLYDKYLTFKKLGECGSSGGDAGREGIGGLSGYSGFIKLDMEGLINNDIIIQQSGENGKPGQPGLGGQRGDSAIREYFIRDVGTLSKALTFGLAALGEKYEWLDTGKMEVSSERCGNDGKTSQKEISVSQIQPQRPQINFYGYETDYLKFVSDLELKESKLLDRYFCKLLINSTSNLPLNINSLIRRFKILNKFENRKLLPLLQNEIVEYYNTDHLSLNQKTILSYIYTAVKSSIIRYNSEDEPILIVNIKKYLEITRDEIKTWEKLSKQDIRNVYKINFENNLKKKMEEATVFINLLQSDIEKEQREMNSIIIDVLKKISELKNKSRSSDTQYLKIKSDLNEQLARNLVLKSVLGILKIGCTVLSFSSPIGKIAASMMQIGLDTGINIANAHRDKSIELKSTGLDQHLDKAINEYKSLLKEENIKHIQKETLKNTHNSEKISNTLKTGKIVSELYKDIADVQKLGNKEIEKIEEAIDKNADIYEDLDKIEKSIDDFQNGMFKKIQNELNGLKNDLQEKSVFVLNFAKWEIGKKLNELRGQLVNLMSNIEGNSRLTKSIYRVEEAIKTIIDIYKGIDTFKQQIEFSDLLVGLAQTELETELPVEYQLEINSLKKSIDENIIKERYYKALEAFRYWAFPLYCEKTKNLKIGELNGNHENIADMINSYSATLDRLYNKINNDDVQINVKIDNHLQSFEFDNGYSFFEWSSIDYPFEIDQLLRGEKVVFYADVLSTTYDALKFNEIRVKIEIKSNSSLNQRLKGLLKNFLVELTHSGVSNYKFKEEFYVINLHHNSDQKLTLSYQYGSKGLDNTNKVFEKLASNKPILSPYTFWHIKLDPINDPITQNQISKIFGEISSILENKNEIVLSMHGIGTYVKNSFNSNKRNLSKICSFDDIYYKAKKYQK